MIKYTQEDVADHHGVSAVIKDKDGKILMQEHVKFGFWTIPVGKVKIGQEIEEGLKQELFEECNVVVKDFKELICKDYLYERDGKMVKVISHLFEIKEYSGEIKNKEPEKHKQQRFMSLDEIKKLHYLSDMTLLYLSLNGFTRDAKI